jgi:transcriptional antiterminator RfaH
VLSPSIWLPAIKAWRNANGALRAAVPERIAPLFPRYLFVRFSLGADGWKRIRRLPGVDYLFASPSGIPVPRPDQAIEWIRTLNLPEGRMAANGCFYPANVHATPLAIGATAQVMSGPMADLTGICEWSDGRRVRLLLNLLGRAVPITVPQSAVKPVAA